MDAMDDDFSLDEARDTLFTLARACERFSASLSKVVEQLNEKKPEDEWLLLVLDEAKKGVSFHEQQQHQFTAFSEKAQDYVEAVRREADQLAMQELSGRGEQEQGEEREGAADAGASSSAAPASGGGAPRRKSSKTLHPELLKFKLEKQARILGKYGGAPALGAGLVLPRLQREAILKATGSPAAREIHYSKVENKEASNLAEVMRFKVRKSEDLGGVPALSPWQAELSTKKGRTAMDGTDEKDLATPSTQSHTAYGEELGGVLQQRQAALEEALTAERAALSAPSASGAGAAGQISADALEELAAKLRRRQSASKQVEDEAAAAAAEAAEAAAPPATPAWSNSVAPFGGELAAAMQRRAEQRRVSAVEAAATPAAPDTAATSAPSTASGAPEEQQHSTPYSVAGLRPVRQASSGAEGPPGSPQAEAAPGPSGPAGDTDAPGLHPGGSSPAPSAEPTTPAPASAVRRSAPSVPAASMVTPAGMSELQQKLLRRRSAVEAQTPSPPQMAEAQ